MYRLHGVLFEPFLSIPYRKPMHNLKFFLCHFPVTLLHYYDIIINERSYILWKFYAAQILPKLMAVVRIP